MFRYFYFAGVPQIILFSRGRIPHTHECLPARTSTHPSCPAPHSVAPGLAGEQVSNPPALDSTVRVLHPSYNLDDKTLHSICNDVTWQKLSL